MIVLSLTEAPVERSFSIEAYLVDGRPRLEFTLVDAELRIKWNIGRLPGFSPEDRMPLSIGRSGTTADGSDDLPSELDQLQE